MPSYLVTTGSEYSTGTRSHTIEAHYVQNEGEWVIFKDESNKVLAQYAARTVMSVTKVEAKIAPVAIVYFGSDFKGDKAEVGRYVDDAIRQASNSGLIHA